MANYRPGTTLGGQKVTKPSSSTSILANKNVATPPPPASIARPAGVTAQPSNRAPVTSLGTGVQKAAPRPIAPSGGGAAYGGGALGSTGTGIVAEQAGPPPQAQSFDDWKGQGGWQGDSAFMAEDASAEAEYQALLNQLGQQNTNYLQDFKGGLRNLGWDYEGENYGQGNWDAEDKLGAYGGAFQGLQNDFSGRGLMDSSFYGQAQNDLTDRFNRQRNDMQTGLNTQQNEFNSNKTNALQSREAAKNRALAEAYSRFSGGYGA